MPLKQCGVFLHFREENHNFPAAFVNLLFPRLFCALLKMKLAQGPARLYLVKAGELLPGVSETSVFLCAQSLLGISTVQLYARRAPVN